ncbi:hypothetical protein S7711_09005 [Stachybotrys chartarum IBT 7711]|uniref:C2H2-type domain-containing protein n=1 Tax=Stachybotrys chartarum (strain CBS 109288 / IBT 7711) TaxID=1280523 RepID=A0A084AX75_STACB|nr:hypothetical protein S7711_09005 [Stachybotrys chartarum IBT 7711]KFA48291.1 hypothetical protein S40293_08811 [Stachybotrys chartarum IBT 40293]KFA76998.1 hypothetical protein S40288_08588 [Stachybotrys chartarum IBT 40288]
MFPFIGQEEPPVRPLTDEDQHLLLGLVRKYGIPSLINALNFPGPSSRVSVLSATTLLSTTSVPSLAWTGSEASHAKSDAASIRTQSTWPDTLGDIRTSISESDVGKVSTDSTWLESPMAITSPLPNIDVTSHPSPRPVVPMNKKYQCPMCFLDKNPVGFGRKSDFKKHLHNFHGADVVWICRTKGCCLSYTTERAYSTHAKEAHRMEALPNSAARTELCPQVVFSCGFSQCKDRIFEAQNNDDASNSRDKYFEHIAKHFEDGYDVNNWDYSVLVHNLMRQQRVKPVWKTCIWPKEKRTQLTWKARSSGDLRRMLECRHLGEEISTLVRLAFILGNAPFTTSSTPPPSEIDLHFQLPFRSQCLKDSIPSGADVVLKSEDTPTTSTFNLAKHRASVAGSVFKIPNRRPKQETRPSTPATIVDDTVMRDDVSIGPHPGTPFPIPSESIWPVDGPKFAPDNTAILPKQMTGSVDATTPMAYPMPIHAQAHQHHQEHQQQQQHQQEQHQQQQHQHQQQHHHQQQHQQLHHQQQVQHHQQQQQAWAASLDQMEQMEQMEQYAQDADDYYTCQMSTGQMTTVVRPATPVPHKRPASWGKVMSLEALRPKKKSTPHGSPCLDAEMMQQVPNMYGEAIPTSMPVGYDLPLRMDHEHMMASEQHLYAAQHNHAPMQLNSPTTFFFDDADVRFG